jgi:divinyl protochlorophyllide a 8-vinyl-reductase
MRTLAASAPDARAETAGRIGPNAAIQLIAALRRRGEDEALEQLFARAGRKAWLDAPPQRMILAREAAGLHVGLRRLLPRARAEAALREAGALTAQYLLDHRIPPWAQFALKRLPTRFSARLLLRAIAAHAWTFVGDGRFEAQGGGEAEARIYENPLCENLRAQAPACVWHETVLQTLFHALVSKSARVRETECRARGDMCCRFSIRYGA